MTEDPRSAAYNASPESQPTPAYQTLIVEQDERGGWAWRCEGCWLGTGLPFEADARAEAATHVAKGHGDPTEWEQPA